MAWTDERVERLKDLWNKGLSASQIAAELGDVTRNAVIGKAHRLGLSGRAKPNQGGGHRGGRRSRAEAPGTRPDPVVIRGGAAPALKFALDEAPEPMRRDLPEPVALKIVKPEGELAEVTLLDLNEKMCKWPIGDPGDEDFHFCGHPSEPGQPYCTKHAKMAYQPAYGRKKAAGK